MRIMEKILLISPQPFFEWRGSPIRVSFNVQALAKLDFSVDLLTLPIGERRELDGVNIIRVANFFKVKKIPIGPSLLKIYFDILIFFRGLQLIRRHKYTAIHGVEEAGLIAVILSKLAGCKAIFEKHSDPFSYKKGFIKNIILIVYAFVEQITVKRSDAVICTGPGLVEQVIKMGYPTPTFHIFDIPSSLRDPAPKQIRRIKQKLQKQEDEILITFVGSFAVYQGIDLMVKAIPEVVRSCPNARFIIIGGTEIEISKRKTILQQQDVLKSVSFMGMIPPDILPEYLFASDILLSPRTSGVNTPLKILDYFKAGRAIVATDIKANRLLLDDELARFASPTPSAMADAIVSLILDGDQRKKIGKNGRRLFENTYNFSNYTKKLSACYERIQARPLTK